MKPNRDNGWKQSALVTKDESFLFSRIEQLRLELIKLVKEKGFADYSVIQLSQQLDQYIYEYQRRIYNKYC